VNGGEALRAFEMIKKCRHLKPVALHVHLGTGLRTPATHAQAAREAIEFAETLSSTLGIVLEHIDLGGGFGVPTVKPLSQIELRMLGAGYGVRPPATGFTIAEFAAEICATLEKYSVGEPDRLPELILEPGRALTSAAQALLLRVLSVKPGDRDVRYAIADGGRNLTMPLAYEYHEVFVANKMQAQAPTAEQTVFGPLCHPADVVVASRELPVIEPGDVLAVMDAGAYFIPNQMTFSHPRPAALMITYGTPRLIREREAFKHVVEHDVFGWAPTSALSNLDSRV
jgi:diaminopimelate decarboxylase